MSECWCCACEDERLAPMELVAAMMYRRFIVCPECGNKRCPKAQHHERPCSGSNDTGQPGGG